MKARAISENINCIHADLPGDYLFEGIWPIPKGVSLNSYHVKGEKTAIIDPFTDWNEVSALGFSEPDYIILNHLEPDHTLWLRGLESLGNPNIEIISTQKGIDLVKSFYRKNENESAVKIRAVKDGDTLDLGKGVVLHFYETPNVHWPETMMTFEPASGTLFSCDAFGSYGALGDKTFDDEISLAEHEFYEAESLRYYANIVASFSTFVRKTIEKAAALDIHCVAPGHGLVWRKNPSTIIDRYAKYAAYSQNKTEAEITIIWGSMYGNTKAGLDAVIRGIKEEGVPYTIHRVPDENISWVLADAFKNSGLVLAMPTYEYAMFPPMAYVLDVFRRKHIFDKKVLRIGSFGWVGGAKKEYEAAIANLRWTSLDSVEWAGIPGKDEIALLEERGRELARMVKAGEA